MRYTKVIFTVINSKIQGKENYFMEPARKLQLFNCSANLIEVNPVFLCLSDVHQIDFAFLFIT
ncbi:hypothetical protein ZOSMA_169G00350 [Zostera marina]|uniref:Uncharacterized protein n=1 Tax=Zostera marina TaxID=29655 RepID=A0A0K9PT71_ZOSMR|nr:hypothetical protein ZOSMA_169G00350 [Zostera marina]